MAFQFVAAAHYDSTGSTTLVCNKPTGTTTNDLMVALIKRVNGSIETPTLPDAGWNLIASQANGAFGNEWYLYYKVATSGDSGTTNYTWTYTNSVRCGVTISTYRDGFDTGDPIDVYSSTSYTSLDTALRAAAMTVSAANSPIIFAGGVHSGTTYTFSPPTVPATMTEDVDTANDGNGRFSRTFAHVVWSGSGSTGTMNASISGSIEDKHAFAIALNPTASAPTISDAGDESFYNGETGCTITGTGFGSSQGNGTVKISPTNNVNDAGAVAQTVTSWGASSIQFTCVKSTLSFLTNYYLFVTENGGTSNATGYQVQIEPRVYIREKLVDLDGNTVNNESGLTAFVWRAIPSNTNQAPAECLTSKTTDADGDIDWQITRGSLVSPNPVWVAIFKDGTPFRATMRKVTPVYE